MTESFLEMLAVGGKTNSLGRANEVIAIVLEDKSRLDELYGCVFAEDAWVRMRAIDSIEKVCRVHPEWFIPYVDKFNKEIAESTQPSVQWHLAEMYSEIPLTESQQQFAVVWLTGHLATTDVDWIVASNAMGTLVRFAKNGVIPKAKVIPLLEVQQHHKSKAIIKRATNLLNELS